MDINKNLFRIGRSGSGFSTPADRPSSPPPGPTDLTAQDILRYDFKHLQSMSRRRLFHILREMVIDENFVHTTEEIDQTVKKLFEIVSFGREKDFEDKLRGRYDSDTSTIINGGFSELSLFETEVDQNLNVDDPDFPDPDEWMKRSEQAAYSTPRSRNSRIMSKADIYSMKQEYDGPFSYRAKPIFPLRSQNTFSLSNMSLRVSTSSNSDLGGGRVRSPSQASQKCKKAVEGRKAPVNTAVNIPPAAQPIMMTQPQQLRKPTSSRLYPTTPVLRFPYVSKHKKKETYIQYINKPYRTSRSKFIQKQLGNPLTSGKPLTIQAKTAPVSLPAPLPVIYDLPSAPRPVAQSKCMHVKAIDVSMLCDEDEDEDEEIKKSPSLPKRRRRRRRQCKMAAPFLEEIKEIPDAEKSNSQVPSSTMKNHPPPSSTTMYQQSYTDPLLASEQDHQDYTLTIISESNMPRFSEPGRDMSSNAMFYAHRYISKPLMGSMSRRPMDLNNIPTPPRHPPPPIEQSDDKEDEYDKDPMGTIEQMLIKCKDLDNESLQYFQGLLKDITTTVDKDGLNDSVTSTETTGITWIPLPCCQNLDWYYANWTGIGRNNYTESLAARHDALQQGSFIKPAKSRPLEELNNNTIEETEEIASVTEVASKEEIHPEGILAEMRRRKEAEGGLRFTDSTLNYFGNCLLKCKFKKSLKAKLKQKKPAAAAQGSAKQPYSDEFRSKIFGGPEEAITMPDTTASQSEDGLSSLKSMQTLPVAASTSVCLLNPLENVTGEALVPLTFLQMLQSSSKTRPAPASQATISPQLSEYYRPISYDKSSSQFTFSCTKTQLENEGSPTPPPWKHQ